MISRPDVALSRSAAAATGFTLIEILVVLAILAFSFTLVAGYRPPWSRGLEIDATAAKLASELRLVRSEAIAANQPSAFELDAAGRRYRSGSDSPRALPGRMAVELLTIAGEQQGSVAGRIRFYPDGSSTGGRIVLAERGRRVAIGVDWLTGRVSVADVR
jgi:general secretion pathway protein H